MTILVVPPDDVADADPEHPESATAIAASTPAMAKSCFFTGVSS